MHSFRLTFGTVLGCLFAAQATADILIDRAQSFAWARLSVYQDKQEYFFDESRPLGSNVSSERPEFSDGKGGFVEGQSTVYTRAPEGSLLELPLLSSYIYCSVACDPKIYACTTSEGGHSSVGASVYFAVEGLFDLETVGVSAHALFDYFDGSKEATLVVSRIVGGSKIPILKEVWTGTKDEYSIEYQTIALPYGDYCLDLELISSGAVETGGFDAALVRLTDVQLKFGDTDTDGDGLLDDWEANGVPYTRTDGGEGRLMLPGARVLRKNLYVEVDAMSGVRLPMSEPGLPSFSAEMVRGAFFYAPIGNPDGSTGIDLHIQRDDRDLPFLNEWQLSYLFGCWPPDNFNQYRNHPLGGFGTDAQRASPDATALLEAKSKAYRYGVVASRLSQYPSKHPGGCAEIAGDNFVIALDGLQNEEEVAALLMHELGHNLGLQHGGGDNINGKPNYPSIMNYILAYRYEFSRYFWRLDYSRAGSEYFASLNESSLNEPAGIGIPGGWYDLYGYQMPYGCNVVVGNAQPRYVQIASLNGAPTDFGNPSGSALLDGRSDSIGIAQDLNYISEPIPGYNLPAVSSPGQILHPYNDWVRVDAGLGLRANKAWLRGIEPDSPFDELSIETKEWLDQNIPASNANCPGDINGDRQIGFADLNVVLANFNISGLGLYGDIDADGDVDFGDLNIVVSAFNTACP